MSAQKLKILSSDKNRLVIQTRIVANGSSKQIRITRLCDLYGLTLDREYKITIEPVGE